MRNKKNWLCDFAFALFTFLVMNELSRRLQGKDQLLQDTNTHLNFTHSPLTIRGRTTASRWKPCTENSAVGRLAPD